MDNQQSTMSKIIREAHDFLRTLAEYLIATALICYLAMMMTSCASSKRVVTEKQTKTEYKERIRTVHDTVQDTVFSHSFVYKHDSVIVREKGDTVFIDRWHTLLSTETARNAHKSAINHVDTVFISKTDTISVPVANERKTTKWEAFKKSLHDTLKVVAFLAIVALFVYVIYLVVVNKDKF